MRKTTLSAIILLAIATTTTAQCPPMGLILTETGDRMGDPFSIDLFGTPSVAGLLAIDVSPGPVSTPVGTVCLGLTPATLFSPFTLNGLGTISFGGILPALPFLTGFTAYLQAGAADGTQPGGFALSNGASVTLRSPRLFFITPGTPANPFGPPAVPGTYCFYDALADTPTSGAITLPSQVVDAAMAPDLGWLVILLANSSLLALDADTGVPVLSLALPPSPGPPSMIEVDGSTLFVLYSGLVTPFGSTPGAVRGYSLPSGTPGLIVPLTANPSAMLPLPGTGLAYLRIGSTVVPIDVISGTLFPAIDMVPGTAGAISDWRLVGNILYCLMPGASPDPFGGTGTSGALNAVDTSVHMALFASAVPLGVVGPNGTLRYGPSAGGNAIYVHAGSTSSLLHISPTTLMVNGAIPVGGGFLTMELSDGGSEWLMLCNGVGCGGAPVLQTMNPSTFVITNVAPAGAVQPMIVPLPSATLNKAYMISGPSTLVPINTDPTTVPSFIVPLPVSAFPLRVVVD